MEFDSCEHKIRRLLIDVAKAVRRKVGLPEETDVAILYKESLDLLNLGRPQNLNSSKVSHLPAPHEMASDDGKPTIPRLACEECGSNESMVLRHLCSSCKDSEGGVYHTMWECHCGYKVKSKKFLIQWFKELNVVFKAGTKSSMGVLTITDDGLK